MCNFNLKTRAYSSKYMVIPATRTDITFTSSLDATNLVDLSLVLKGDVVEVSADSSFRVIVLSLSGKILLKKKIEAEGMLNIGKLKSGKYLLKIESDTNTSVTILERE